VAGESASGRAGWLVSGLPPGAVVAGYRLEARIGAGGMAVVFRARDSGLGRTVALKVLAPALAGDGAPLGTISDPGGSGVRSLGFNLMGTQLAVADKNGTTYVWNLAD